MTVVQGATVLGLRPLRQPGSPPRPAPPMYDWSSEADETIPVALSPLEWSMVYTALHHEALPSAQHPALQPYVDLAAKIRELVRPRRVID